MDPGYRNNQMTTPSKVTEITRRTMVTEIRRAGNAVEPDPEGAWGVQGVSFALFWLKT